MKKAMTKMVVTSAMAGLMATMAWAGNMRATQPYGQGPGMAGYVTTLPAGELSEAEAATLLHMREEEKLARDVYTSLYGVWNHWAFERIAQSEQRHMDAVLGLMEKYDVADPVTDDTTGTFADIDMEALYEQMVATGAESLADALRVGATIEDLDIFDLLNAIPKADDEDLSTVYQNLLKGSRNHLRTFVYQLGVLGETYAPQYISDEDFAAIVTSPRERGLVDADGNPVITGNGQGRCSRGKGTGDCPTIETGDTDADTSEDLSMMLPIDRTPLLARGGNGGGGRGPGDGNGNGGQGPKDGSGNGRKRGTCINTDAASAGADMLLARGGNGNGTGNGGDGPGDGTGDCTNV